MQKIGITAAGHLLHTREMSPLKLPGHYILNNWRGLLANKWNGSLQNDLCQSCFTSKVEPGLEVRLAYALCAENTNKEYFWYRLKKTVERRCVHFPLGPLLINDSVEGIVGLNL